LSPLGSRGVMGFMLKSKLTCFPCDKCEFVRKQAVLSGLVRLNRIASEVESNDTKCFLCFLNSYADFDSQYPFPCVLQVSYYVM